MFTSLVCVNAKPLCAEPTPEPGVRLVLALFQRQPSPTTRTLAGSTLAPSCQDLSYHSTAQSTRL